MKLEPLDTMTDDQKRKQAEDIRILWDLHKQQIIQGNDNVHRAKAMAERMKRLRELEKEGF